ncbi:MobA/MobL family protein [Escherichia albertii]|nr:MobA/MobL family protein [Escherichia albertii]
MASYHCTVKAGAKGSALKHADYISRSGEYKSYKSREDLEFSSSGNMPSWAKKNPAELWKAADEFERKNGTAYREIEIALPRELTREQRIELVEDFVQKELGDRHAYQYAIHNPPGAIDGKEQPHAHIMFCERINDGIERDPQQFFKRANSKSPERGGAKKASIPQTAGERKAALVALRSRWADVQNEHLARYGHESRVDHRSLKEQGINRTPEVHLRGLFRGADKREIDARILEQKSVLETAEHERNEFRNKLQQAESEWDKENAAFKRTEGYKYVGDLDRYREREILAAASLENTRQKVAEEVSVARSQMLSLEPELSISGDEKAQMRHELLAEMAQERQQQEEKALRIQRSWAREASRSNERDQDMER